MQDTCKVGSSALGGTQLGSSSVGPAYATIDDLRESLAQPARHGPEYRAKMVHEVPKTDVVDRAKFILERCKDKVVLDIGASGPMHEAIRKVAKQYVGVDREAKEYEGVVALDLDGVMDCLSKDAVRFGPLLEGVEVVVCGEVLEHLSNPGNCLKWLRRTYPGALTIITAPNAFSKAGFRNNLEGTENVNIDHVAWYSWRTLKTLVERCGYEVESWYWYKGEPLTAEGLVFVVR